MSVGRVRLLAAIAAVAAIVGVGQSAVQSQRREAPWSIDDLGPGGFLALPPALGLVVDGSDAAVVARIVGTEGMTFEELDNPYSEKKSLRGYAMSASPSTMSCSRGIRSARRRCWWERR